MRQLDRRQVSYGKCEQIEIQENRKKKPPLVLRQKKHTRWNRGFCKMCQEPFEYISQDHAKMHGFRNADDMAMSDQVVWMD